MTDIERLAIAQAIYKAVAEQVSAKDPDSLRGRADADMLRNYKENGMKSTELRVMGQKVGTYSVRVKKETPSRTVAELVCDDREAALAWATSEAGQDFDGWVLAHMGDFAKWYFETTGEVPGGCHVNEVEIPAVPEHAEGTTLRVDVPKVAAALGNALPSTLAGLLEGGEG